MHYFEKYKEKLINTSIKNKFIFGIVTILILSIPFISIVFINQSHNLLSEALEDKVRLLNKNFSIVSKNAIQENSFSFLQELIKEVAQKDRELKALVICNNEKTILASSDNNTYQIFSIFKNDTIRKNMRELSQGIFHNDDKDTLESIYFIMSEPVSIDYEADDPEQAGEIEEKNKKKKEVIKSDIPEKTRKKEKVGFVYVSLTTEFLSREVLKLWLFSGIFTFILLLFGIAGAYWIGFNFTHPIVILANKVREITSGNLNIPVESHTTDEIGSLFTDVDKMRISIKDLTENLEAKVEQRTMQLKKATKQLEEANKELEAFSYSVSHDLRTPLRAIDGYTRILIEEHLDSLDSEGRRICSVIRTESQRLGNLIDDLLSFSRFSRSEMKIGPVKMKELAESIFKEISSPEQMRTIDLIIDDIPEAKADNVLIRQVWTNLISNALKFSSKKKHVKIRISGKCENKELVYSIRDNGAGFNMKYVDKLFGVFQRLHRTKEFEGTGVGLAIVQRILHRHGGRIWADAEPDKGATFFFSLPH